MKRTCAVCNATIHRYARYCWSCGHDTSKMPDEDKESKVYMVDGIPVNIAPDEDPLEVLEMVQEYAVKNPLGLVYVDNRKGDPANSPKLAYRWCVEQSIDKGWDIDKDPGVQHILSKDSREPVKRYEELILCSVSKRKANIRRKYFEAKGRLAPTQAQSVLVTAANQTKVPELGKGYRDCHPIFTSSGKNLEYYEVDKMVNQAYDAEDNLLANLEKEESK